MRTLDEIKADIYALEQETGGVIGTDCGGGGVMKEKRTPPPAGGEVLVYQTEDGRIKLDVRLEDETVWLTQQMMAELS